MEPCHLHWILLMVPLEVGYVTVVLLEAVPDEVVVLSYIVHHGAQAGQTCRNN